MNSDKEKHELNSDKAEEVQQYREAAEQKSDGVESNDSNAGSEETEPITEAKKIDNSEINLKKGDGINGYIDDNGKVTQVITQDEAARKLKEVEEKYIRLMAEFDNYKKRTAREFQEYSKSAKKDLLFQLLTVVDHFELALNTELSGDAESYKKGIELIYKEMVDFLHRQGVMEIESENAEFDPNIHEAVMQTPDEEVPEGFITTSTQKGYKLGDRVLRPAKVIISAGPPETEDKNESNSEE
ncbi:MAG: nucleotide exchange factor GrpE [candidate division Zixibacteria bacterium]|nr:nucleotide exchange factor GrpE [candidate division Zixibacteria bacterium]